MRHIILIFLAFFLLTLVGHGGTFFDPQKLDHITSNWHYISSPFKNEHYEDYFYDGQVVFRILPRFMPMISCLIAEAKRVSGKLHLKHGTHFKSADAIKENFHVFNNN